MKPPQTPSTDNDESSLQPTSDPPTSDQPTSDQPTLDQPTSDQPTSDQPTSDQPTSDQPTSDQPASDQSASDQSASDQSASDQPISGERGEKPTGTKAQRLMILILVLIPFLWLSIAKAIQESDIRNSIKWSKLLPLIQATIILQFLRFVFEGLQFVSKTNQKKHIFEFLKIVSGASSFLVAFIIAYNTLKIRKFNAIQQANCEVILYFAKPIPKDEIEFGGADGSAMLMYISKNKYVGTLSRISTHYNPGITGPTNSVYSLSLTYRAENWPFKNLIFEFSANDLFTQDLGLFIPLILPPNTEYKYFLSMSLNGEPPTQLFNPARQSGKNGVMLQLDDKLLLEHHIKAMQR